MDQPSNLNEHDQPSNLNERDQSTLTGIITNIQNEIVELKKQHNALVRTTSRKSDVNDKIPGYSLLDALWKKAYFTKIVNGPDLYKVKLFVLPDENVSGANDKGADVGGGQNAAERSKSRENTKNPRTENQENTKNIIYCNKFSNK